MIASVKVTLRVDGIESDRGGFTGHPMSEFCRTIYHGDNELHSSMSTEEHYTCHMCQRQHPGKYEYHKNYDDLELLSIRLAAVNPRVDFNIESLLAVESVGGKDLFLVVLLLNLLTGGKWVFLAP